MSPKRIQRKRIKGWRMPEGAIYVGRPSKFGNPFTGNGDRDLAVERYREWMLAPHVNSVVAPSGYYYYNHGPFAGDLAKLRGHDLACWCPLDQPCHADVLLELANGGV